MNSDYVKSLFNIALHHGRDLETTVDTSLEEPGGIILLGHIPDESDVLSAVRLDGILRRADVVHVAPWGVCSNGLSEGLELCADDAELGVEPGLKLGGVDEALAEPNDRVLLEGGVDTQDVAARVYLCPATGEGLEDVVEADILVGESCLDVLDEGEEGLGGLVQDALVGVEGEGEPDVAGEMSAKECEIVARETYRWPPESFMD
jgi:hypothetical protein